MKRLFVALPLLLAAVGWAALPPAWDARSPTRHALAAVVRACALNDRLTGSPAPCREVIRAPDPRASYALLREPVGRGRTVVAPLASIRGIETPALRAPGAPNLFATTWGRRHALIGGAAERDVALAVNARYSRTQDRLHIHVACLRPDARRSLDAVAATLPSDRFARLDTPILGNHYWARRFVLGDVVNPFAVVADGVPGAAADMAIYNIAMVEAPGSAGVLVLASRTDRARFYDTGAEHLLDPSCGASRGS